MAPRDFSSIVVKSPFDVSLAHELHLGSENGPAFFLIPDHLVEFPPIPYY